MSPMESNRPSPSTQAERPLQSIIDRMIAQDDLVNDTTTDRNEVREERRHHKSIPKDGNKSEQRAVTGKRAKGGTPTRRALSRGA